MEWLSQKIDNLLGWFRDLFIAVFAALWDFLADVLINGLDLLLSGVSAAIAAIPAPSFASATVMQSLVNQLPTGTLYFLSQSQLAQALAILGAGLAFRLLRKAVTLGQW